VDFISLSESVDTSTPVGKTIFTVLVAVGELDRNLIKERAYMGISRARKRDKALGRPRVELDPLQVAGLRSRGLSWNQIAETLNVGRDNTERAYRSLSQKPLRTVENALLIQ
jgi:DNA invertase Pin-like site-specific DNA recombinase